MDEIEFTRLADAALGRIEDALDAATGDLDFELAEGGVLRIDCPDGQIIVNRHSAAREVWVAARSGGFHYRWDGSAWVDSRTGEALGPALQRLIKQQGGGHIDLD